MGYMVRKKVSTEETAPGSEERVVKVHEEAGCVDDYLHTPGGVEFPRGGRRVFSSPEEAAEDDRQHDDAGGAQQT
jgi:hypothetical protein